MGSAITFSDKIASKNCQNLQNLPGELPPLCTSAGGNSCNSGNHSQQHHNHRHFSPRNHVDVNYCEYEEDLEESETILCFEDKTKSDGEEEESTTDEEEEE